MDLIAVWNDPAMLRKLGGIFQCLVWVFMFFVIVAQVAKWRVDIRERNLNASLAAKNEQERLRKESELETRFKGSEEELIQLRATTDIEKERVKNLHQALTTADDKLRAVEGQLQEARSKITSLSSRLVVRFSGKWSSEPYPRQILSPVSDEYYVELTSNSTKEVVRFYATEPYTFKTVDAKSAFFESIQAVRSGDFPLGGSVSSLERLNNIVFHIPFIMWETIVDKSIKIENITLKFFVNGEQRHALSYDDQFVVPVVRAGNIGLAHPFLKLEPKILTPWLSYKK